MNSVHELLKTICTRISLHFSLNTMDVISFSKLINNSRTRQKPVSRKKVSLILEVLSSFSSSQRIVYVDFQKLTVSLQENNLKHGYMNLFFPGYIK